MCQAAGEREVVPSAPMALVTLKKQTGQRIAAYIRVSSPSQSYATQRHSIDQAARARKDRIGWWFAEKQSGRTLKRPVLDEVRAAARRGELSKLYVYRVDRLTRSGVRDMLNVIAELREHGCKVVTVADAFDLGGGPFDEMILACFAACAEVERIKINENISAARARVEARGGQWGRPRRADDDVVARVRALKRREPDWSIRKISIAAKIPRTTVADILSEKGAYARRRLNGQKNGKSQVEAGASG